MKKFILLIFFSFCFIFAFSQSKSKKIYFTDPGELIFQFSQANIEDSTAENGVRTTYFTNIPYYMNINCNNYFGLMTGISIKNIGIKTKNEQIDDITYNRIKRRVFTSGLSMAMKCGFFDKGIWAFAGAGIDWAFHYKQKYYETSGRKNVIKKGEWMSNATPTYIPSVFFGIQTPISLNIKATYYLNDFLNKDYKGSLGDFSKFKSSQLMTISFSLILKEMPEKYSSEIPLDQPSKREKTIEL